MIRVSRLALPLARRHPQLTTVGLRLWAEVYYHLQLPPHWLFRSLKNELGLRLAKPLSLSTGDVLFADPFDPIGADIARKGVYEPETVAIFERILKPGMVVLDIGAHIGQYTVISSRMVGASGHVYAFEPDPRTFRELDRNAHRRTNVTCSRFALGDRAGDELLYVGAPHNTAGSSLRATSECSGTCVSVKVRRLDDFVSEYQIRRIDLLKADVEGAELLVLRGGAQSVRFFRPIMILEFSVHSVQFGYTAADVWRYLTRLGYVVFRISTPPLPAFTGEAAGASFFNVLAVPSGRAPEFVSAGLIDESAADTVATARVARRGGSSTEAAGEPCDSRW